MSWVELGEVTCRGHVSYQGKSALTEWQRAVRENDKGNGFNIRASSAKRRCQLIIKLKANKCY